MSTSDSWRQRSGVFDDGKAIHAIEAVTHVAPSFHSHLCDTALRAYSGQAVDLEEAPDDRQRSEIMLLDTSKDSLLP